MKKLFVLLVLIVAGLGVGGGAAFATMLVAGPRGAAGPSHVEIKPNFVDAGKVLAPLVFADGRLSSYVEFSIQLEAPEDRKEFITERLPLLMHAINMRTYRTPMAAGPDGLLPNLEEFRKVVEAAAPEAFGAGVVRKIAVTQAMPA